tara:strand:+ start:3248 stop:4012 length:765 start_codon:yes stop_codon:yes gene_type:complete
MTAVLRSDLISRIRERAGMELGPYPVTGQFVTDDELKLMADEGARGLYDLMLTYQGKEYFATDVDIPTVNGTRLYSLPANFYQLLAVRGFHANRFFDIRPWDVSHELELMNLSVSGGQAPEMTMYRTAGTQSAPGVAPTLPVRQLSILPIPTQVFFLSIRYVPACVRADTTTDDVYYDGVSGWEEWIIWDCVAKMLAKQESDPSFAMSQRQQVEMRVRGLAGSLDRLHPEVAQDWQQERRARARLRLPRRRVVP